MSIYSSIRINLSKSNQGRLSKYIIQLGFKPSCNKVEKSPFAKGIVVFSADFEMAWAFRYSKKKSSEAVQMGLKERKNFSTLLDLFNKYDVPVTWATVGHLFLNSCKRTKEVLAHPDLKRPDYFENRNWKFNSGDWYDHDPCTNVKKDPAWYAPDLIEKVLQSNTKHEIGCHTFSHIDFSNRNCPPELAESEISKCIQLASEKKLQLKSMVFPGGTAGNFEVIRQYGFTCYRKPMNYHIALPEVDEFGLIAIPSSLGIDKDPYDWSAEFHLKMLKNFLEKTIKYKLVCHFWFHPSMDSWYLKNVMPELLKMVDEYRDDSKIQIKTMSQVAKQYKELLK